jgi:hypothetical protein
LANENADTIKANFKKAPKKEGNGFRDALKQKMDARRKANLATATLDTISIDSRGGFDLEDGNPERRLILKKKNKGPNKWAQLAESRKEILS